MSKKEALLEINRQIRAKRRTKRTVGIITLFLILPLLFGGIIALLAFVTALAIWIFFGSQVSHLTLERAKLGGKEPVRTYECCICDNKLTLTKKEKEELYGYKETESYCKHCKRKVYVGR